MRLNQFQKDWIDILKSGKTRKYKTALKDPLRGAYCCLGIACKLAGEEMGTHADLTYLESVMAKLRLNTPNGHINWDLVRGEWQYLNTGAKSLAGLNDADENISHKVIGEFIEQNPEAVFMSPSER